MKTARPLVTAENLIFMVSNRPLLNIASLAVDRNQTIGILGANGSGKSLLAGILAGEIPPGGQRRHYNQELSGVLKIDGEAALVSFGEQAIIMEQEKYFDDTEFMEGAKDPGRSVRDFICGAPPGSAGLSVQKFCVSESVSSLAAGLMEKFGMIDKRDRGLRFLSTGEFRKTMICRSLIDQPALLILDDPFSGLDREAVADLKAVLKELKGELTILVLSGKMADIPSECDSIRILSDGVLTPPRTPREAREEWRVITGSETASMTSFSEKIVAEPPVDQSEELIEMCNVDVSYLDTPILKDINWTVTEAGHWQIAGPNGSGKSTLLSLITGDNPKAFGQDITLFGKKKGSGESVWEIKQNIGFVSGAFHLGYLKGWTVKDVVLSGFFDTIGLYDKPNPVQVEKASEWCRGLGLKNEESHRFSGLSFGLQRSVLIARSMVKSPRLLILDEPCQGLDDAHTEQVLQTIELIGSSKLSTLLYVSHREEQKAASIKNLMTLVPHKGGGSTAVLSREE